jgi:hypothetical protein
MGAVPALLDIVHLKTPTCLHVCSGNALQRKPFRAWNMRPKCVVQRHQLTDVSLHMEQTTGYNNTQPMFLGIGQPFKEFYSKQDTHMPLLSPSFTGDTYIMCPAQSYLNVSSTSLSHPQLH